MWCDVDPDKVSSLQSNDDEDKEQVEPMVGATNRSMAAVGDVERIEINEAFAAVPLAVAQELGLPEDIINVEGGAIAHSGGVYYPHPRRRRRGGSSALPARKLGTPVATGGTGCIVKSIRSGVFCTTN
jgi:hypothetical protein